MLYWSTRDYYGLLMKLESLQSFAKPSAFWSRRFRRASKPANLRLLRCDSNTSCKSTKSDISELFLNDNSKMAKASKNLSKSLHHSTVLITGFNKDFSSDHL